jgi:uncharacterized protein
MPSSANALRVNIAELMRHPGATRAIDVTLEPAELKLDDPRISGLIQVEVTLTSGIDGVTTHGEVRTPWHSECRRCLIDVDGVAVSEIDEVYQLDPLDGEAFPIIDNQVDLAPAVREYLLLDLPVAPLCRPDCAGICPECGADRNLAACGCAQVASDPRWAALEGLELDD